jgi:hypothetical protein
MLVIAVLYDGLELAEINAGKLCNTDKTLERSASKSYFR